MSSMESRLYSPQETQQPQQPQVQASANYQYNYDPYNIQYQQMTVEQWQGVQSDPSPYSSCWDNQEAFKPLEFSRNTQMPKKYNDLSFMIAFWVNVLVTVALAIFAFASKPKESQNVIPPNLMDSNSTEPEVISSGKLVGNIFIALAIGIVVNVVHFCYASFLPYYYVKLGLFIGVGLAIISAVILSFKVSFLCLIFPCFFVIVAIIVYCVMKDYIPLSAAILKQTCQLLRQYPSIIALCAFQCFIDILVNMLFGALVFFIVRNGWSYWLYIYVVFSYYWIAMTFGYVTYMTGAGLAASWYFLNGSPYMPENPVWSSYKRAMTTSFGSAACAGFLVALIEALKVLIQSSDSDNLFINIMRCVAYCILRCLEFFVKWMNHYALIYCAIFGVPYNEACRRWAEISCKKFCDVIIHGCIISDVVCYNLFIFVIMGALIGFGIGLIMGSASAILVCVFSLLFSFALFLVLEQPLNVISDTLIICWCEAPEKLQTSASELYQTFNDLYQLSIRKKIKA